MPQEFGSWLRARDVNISLELVYRMEGTKLRTSEARHRWVFNIFLDNINGFMIEFEFLEDHIAKDTNTSMCWDL